jgi:H+/Cl- antiporter ClcA
VKRFWGLVLSTVVLGLLVGCSSGLLGILLVTTEHWFLGFVESSSLPGPTVSVPWRRLVSVAVGGVIVAFVWWRVRKPGRIPTVKAAVAGEKLPWWRTVAHVGAQIFFVGTGASIGREVAPREAGSLIAQQWMRVGSRLGLREEDARLLTAAAAGAGFAGVYISPLTGMFFSVEMLLRRVDRETVSVSLGMSAIATLVGSLVKGTRPYYVAPGSFSVSDFAAFSPWLLVFAVVSAPLFGAVGAGFRMASAWAEKRKTTGTAILWQLPAAAVLTGVIAMVAPQVMGNGRALAQFGMNSGVAGGVPVAESRGNSGLGALSTSASSADFAAGTAILILLVLCLAKAVLTILTLKAGASGGVLTPAIGIGSSLGAVFGLVCTLVIPGFTAEHVWQCAIAGAVAVLSASQQAPLMALAMLVEISHLPIQSVVPLGVAAAISVTVASAILTHSRRESVAMPSVASQQ